MSRDLYVAALDLDAFRRVQGSRDAALVERVRAEKARMIEAADDFFRRSTCAHDLAVLAALARIVDGAVTRASKPEPQYEHAAALLADTLGEAVDNELVREAVPDFYVPVDSAIRQRTRAAGLPRAAWPALEEVMGRGPLLDIPLDGTCRLGTGYLTHVEIAAALETAEQVELGDPASLQGVRWPEEALEIASAYRDWLRAADRRSVGLFLHYG